MLIRIIKTSDPQKIPDSLLFGAEIKDSTFKLHGWVVIHSFGFCATILRKFGEHIAPLINSKVYQQ